MKLFDSKGDQFRNETIQLGLVYSSLPLYVNCFFSELQNKVDITCQYFLLNQNDATSEKSVAALENQILIIENLKKFESNCLENLNKNNFQEVFEFIDNTGTRAKSGQDSLILPGLLNIQKQLFHNKSCIFLETNSTLLRDTHLDLKSFGALVIVEDEFILDDTFNFNNNTETFDNQKLKREFLKMCLKAVQNQEGIKAVYQLYLHLEKVDICDLRLRHLKELDSDLFEGVKNLVNIDLSHNELTILNPGTFRNLNCLEVLNLSHNFLLKISSDVFKGIHNLKKLYLTNNKLTNLDSLIFSDLKNLEHIEIYQNFLNLIDYKLFRDLNKLENIGLGQNRLDSIDSRTFQGLISLKYLNLSNNQISILSPNTFQGLKELKSIDLSSNLLRLLDEATFQSLENLEFLCLGDNSLLTLDNNIFQSLKMLKCLYIEGNNLNKETVSFIQSRRINDILTIL